MSSTFDSDTHVPFRIERFRGAEISLHTFELAHLRSQIFRAWPYLFDGTVADEEEDIRRLAASEQAFMVAAFDGDALIGAATAAPLLDYFPIFAQAFEDYGLPAEKVCYFAESVLKADYRGHGLGHVFFEERERHAYECGFSYASFAAVVRPEDHPLRPARWRQHDVFWQGHGYQKAEGLISHMVWKDIDKDEEDAKPMQFWIKVLA